MADDAVGLAGWVHHDRAELVVGDVAKERGEDSVVSDVGVDAGSLVEANAVESVEVEMGREVLGVGMAGEEVQHWAAGGGWRGRHVGRATCPLWCLRSRLRFAAEGVCCGEAEEVSGEDGGRVAVASRDPGE